jgi:ankyrin repeat protein
MYITGSMSLFGSAKEKLRAKSLFDVMPNMRDCKALYSRKPRCVLDMRDGEYPIHIAAKNGYDDCVKFLLRAKVNPNLSNEEGWTPLHVSARYGNTRALCLLLASGARVREKGKEDWTALHLASLNNHESCVAELLRAGADTEAETIYSCTALHLACWAGNTKCVKLLLRAGARIDMENDSGQTPLHCAILNSPRGEFPPRGARLNKHRKCIDILIKAGANPHTINCDDAYIRKYQIEDRLIHLLYIYRNCQIREARYDLAPVPNQSAKLYNNLFIHLYDKSIIIYVRKYM